MAEDIGQDSCRYDSLAVVTGAFSMPLRAAAAGGAKVPVTRIDPFREQM